MKFLMCCIPGAIVAAFLAIILSAGCRKWYTRAATFLLTFTLITLIMGGCFYEDLTWDEKQYNNGICDTCGGSYEFVNASRYRNRTTYYWECDNCGRILETDYNFRG